MHDSIFYRLGKWVYSWRWFIMAFWLGIILCCAPFIANFITVFKTTGFIDDRSKSALETEFINKNLKYNKDNQFIIIYHSRNLSTENPIFLNKIKKSLSEIKNFPLKKQIFYPDDNPKQISKDKHTAYVVIMLKKEDRITDDLLAKLKNSIKKPSNMSVQIGGELIFQENLTKQTQLDLYKADFVATPVAIVTLILVFGSIMAALLPIILGGGCAVFILTMLYLWGHVFTLSIFTINIALLLGLCLSLDYALFMISRFRDELQKKRTVVEAIAVTEATAGNAIFFSGLAVFVSLSGLFLFPVNVLFSMAMGGLTAVSVGVLNAILFLPAVLSILGPRINKWPIKLFKTKNKRAPVWHWIAETVVSHPKVFISISLLILLTLAYPIFSARFGVSDFRIFPKHSTSRDFFNTYGATFKEAELNPISMVVHSNNSSILSKNNISRLYDLNTKLKNNSAIAELKSIVNTSPRLSKSQYYDLYHANNNAMSPSIKKLLETTTRSNFTVMTIVSKYEINSPKTQNLITDLKNTKTRSGLQQIITGVPVSNADVLGGINQMLPYAIAWIIFFTYLILLVLLRSVVLPFKAIIMNLLSLGASYGALVFIFQEGYFHNILNFEPQGMLDISLLVIIFCALFGFSMDYEVFLLTRIKESYDEYKDNKKSIIFGIEKSSRIITSAAIIVIFLCGSFLVADVILVKAFGLGIAVAIFVDAFIIRTILVPATMTMLNTWNWYLPRWLNKILPKI